MREIKKEQIDFLDWELGAFFHFGIRTFYEGHRDWDMKEMPLSGFNPTDFDAEQWIRTSKEAGATYAILVCKHHDGFANWPSKYTDYSVANTPWRDGKGDVVREFVDACRKYQLKVGLYYSPAQFGSVNINGKEYDDYFINQISELLTNYGTIDYLWFDGCGSEGHNYDQPRIVKAIRQMQPNILIFNMWDPDTRWVGNECGMVQMPNYLITDDVDFSVRTEEKEGLGEARYLPAECDCRIRLDNWFYSDSDLNTLKSVDELVGIYYYSVGRGANMLINIGPDRRGQLPIEDSERIIEFGKRIKELFGNPITTIENVVENDSIYTIELPNESLVNHVVLSEDITTGNHINSFKIMAYPHGQGAPIEVYQSSTIGHKHICKFPSFFTKKLEVVVSSNVDSSLTDINVYYCN